jgi:hypothetical protein
MTAIKDGVTGGVTLKSPIWLREWNVRESYHRRYYVSGAVDNPIEKAWLRHYVYRDFGGFMGDEEDEL